jgi:hypothetical protein
MRPWPCRGRAASRTRSAPSGRPKRASATIVRAFVCVRACTRGPVPVGRSGACMRSCAHAPLRARARACAPSACVRVRARARAAIVGRVSPHMRARLVRRGERRTGPDGDCRERRGTGPSRARMAHGGVLPGGAPGRAGGEFPGRAIGAGGVLAGGRGYRLRQLGRRAVRLVQISLAKFLPRQQSAQAALTPQAAGWLAAALRREPRSLSCMAGMAARLGRVAPSAPRSRGRPSTCARRATRRLAP